MVRIITDTAADFEPAELKDKNIICVPMTITLEGKEYRENENLTKNEFYEMLEKTEEFPKTSQPSPYDFEVYLNECMEQGDECVIITISSALSGTYQNAVMTKQITEFEGCYIVDSLSAACGERVLVEQAVKLRDEGKSAKEIAKNLENLKKKVKLKACVDTLEYLYRGGRLSKTAYTVGSVANIKPIIAISPEGAVDVFAKTLSVRKGIRTICDNLSKSKVDTSYPVYVLYSYNRKNADILAQSMREMGYDITESNIVNIGATIGAHVGKNACGYVYVEE